MPDGPFSVFACRTRQAGRRLDWRAHSGRRAPLRQHHRPDSGGLESPVLANRNPLLLFRLEGVLLLRLAERALIALLFHDPPRNTREDSWPAPGERGPQADLATHGCITNQAGCARTGAGSRDRSHKKPLRQRPARDVERVHVQQSVHERGAAFPREAHERQE